MNTDDTQEPQTFLGVELTTPERACGASVYWWNGEYEGGCELPEGHEPADRHFDGLSWYDDDMNEVDPPEAFR